MLFEFASIISQDMLKFKRIRKNLNAQFKEFLSRQRNARLSGPSKTKSWINVFKGNEISPATLNKPFYRVQSNQMSGIKNLKILRFSQYFLTIDFLDFAEMRDLLRADAEAGYKSLIRLAIVLDLGHLSFCWHDRTDKATGRFSPRPSLGEIPLIAWFLE